MAGWRAVRHIVTGNPVSVSAWATKDRSCSPVSRAALSSRSWKRWASPSPTCFLRLPLHLSHNQSRRSATFSPSLISHRTSCCIGSTSCIWESPSNEPDASRSPITCPMAHRRLATGCARPWSPKRDRTGAKGQARLFPMDWNAWKKPGRRVISLSWRASPTAGRSGTTTFQPLVCPA